MLDKTGIHDVQWRGKNREGDPNMSMTVSVRLARRDASKVPGQMRHDLRTGKIPAYVDKAATHLNSVVVEPRTASELKTICLERREKRRAAGEIRGRMRSNTTLATVGIVTFGKEAQPIIEGLSRERQDQLFLRAAQAVSDRLGTDVTGLVVHRDESAIHAHFQMPGFSFDGKPLSKIITPQVAAELQDVVGDVYRDFGITRGTPKAERIARGDDWPQIIHRSVARLHDDLPREIAEREQRAAALQAEVEALEKKREYQEKLITRTEALLKEKSADEAKLTKRLQTYQKRIADTEKLIEMKAKELSVVSVPIRQQFEEALGQMSTTLMAVGVNAGKILGVQSPERKYMEVIHALKHSQSLAGFKRELLKAEQSKVQGLER